MVRSDSHPATWFRTALSFVGGAFVAYGLVYFWPGTGLWKDVLTNLLIVLAALWSALAATLIWRAYQAEPGLRRVWFNFAFALWLWTLAEIIWTYQTLSTAEIELGLADLFWVVAYFFFGIALYAQYKLLLIPPRGQGRLVFGVLVLLTFGFTFLLARALAAQQGEALTLHTLVNAFYPAADLAVGLGALYLVYLFRGGLWSRPWLAMFLFTLADGLYAWLFNIGQYTALVESQGWFAYVSDVFYFLAYLLVGLACFAQWLILRYGFFFHETKG